MSNARPHDFFNLCQFQFANKRLCGLPAHPKGDGYCLTHARARYAAEHPPQREDDLSAELRSPAGDFITQIDINTVLGKLFDALAANRLSPRRASSLAYIAFLLLQSQQGAKKEAMRWTVDYPVFEKMLKLKYPKTHPNHPKDRPKPSQKNAAPSTSATPQPPASTARSSSSPGFIPEPATTSVS
ncbi:MAG TPA: hypothetical protein VMH31_05340 [Methylomirabilota bacterium]|nr:hypothetical protein [Methylomirabilota bacterium]